jgi:hypothetical protein
MQEKNLGQGFKGFFIESITEVRVMEKKIYVIRHGSAEGQSSESNLTEKGRLQANVLVKLFTEVNITIERIWSIL